MVEHNLSQLDSLHVPVVMKMESDFFRFEMNVGELDFLPISQVEFELTASNFPPASNHGP